MPEVRWHVAWLSFGLAFVGGYGDAASLVLAKTFTGHLTGNFVLTAISIAGYDWPNLIRRCLAIVLFLTGIVLSVILEQWLARKSSRSLLPAVLGLEIVLISAAYFALTLLLNIRLELFVICMSLALGLQNGVWRKAAGVTVHSTYLTGMVTNPVTSGAKRHIANAAGALEPDVKFSLLSGMWIAFVLGAVLGAVMVLSFQSLGILGAAVMLLALMILHIITS